MGRDKDITHVGEYVIAVELQRYLDLLGSQAILRAAIGQLWRGHDKNTSGWGRAMIGQLWKLELQ